MGRPRSSVHSRKQIALDYPVHQESINGIIRGQRFKVVQ